MKRKTVKAGAVALSVAMVTSIVPAIPGNLTKAAEASGTYSYFDDYSLGYTSAIQVYKKDTGKATSVASAGLKVYSHENDNPFEAQVSQAWDEKNLKLSQPVIYTTSDGKTHEVESMLTNFDFIADPTAIDNSDVDGKLYVYGTTEEFSYENDTMVGNKYANHSLTVLSSSDMVNWTDEGFMDSFNLTNERSDSDSFVKNDKFTSGGQSWAPSGLKIDGDGDGDDEYYIFYTNGGTTGYVMSDSPNGPWKSFNEGSLFSKDSPNCEDCNTCFDPAVLVDDKGRAFVYFGGLTVTSGRACEIQFEKGTGRVTPKGEPVKLPTYHHFEDNEINMFNGKYYYSYCSDWDGSQKLTKAVSICAYVSSDPLDITFDPTVLDNPTAAFTGDDGIYHHFLGTVLDNPSKLYGQTYNNHHHMQSFKGNDYIFYHSTVLNNTLHRTSQSYRNLHVDEITVDKDTDKISITPSYEGAKQIEKFNPYRDFGGFKKLINATTTSYSAGVKSTRDDNMVDAVKEDSDINNGSPMVLDEISTGDWTKLQGVDFGDNGAKKFSAIVNSGTTNGAIELFLDDPTVPTNMVASLPLKDTAGTYETLSVDLTPADVKGEHDVYFVLRGDNYKVSSWKFNEEGEAPDPTAAPTQTPEVTTTPTAVPAQTTTPAASTPTAAPASSAAPAVSTPTVAPADKKIKITKVTAKKNAKKVVLKVTKGSAVELKVYKTLKNAKKAGKTGLVKAYKVKASKNKTGNVTISLKSKLKANMGVLVTISKTGCKSVKVAKKVK